METEWITKQATSKNYNNIGKDVPGNMENICDGVADCYCPPSLYKQRTKETTSDTRCEAKRKVFYLKTFKTASSTLVNILYRHMLALNETILMFGSWNTQKKYDALHADLQKQMLDYLLG